MLNFVVRLDINELRHDGHVISPPLASVKIYDKYTSRCSIDFVRTTVYDREARDIYFFIFLFIFSWFTFGMACIGFRSFYKMASANEN